jgi:hypothetical protein
LPQISAACAAEATNKAPSAHRVVRSAEYQHGESP